MELERVKTENRGLLQKAALLESLSAEAEALRQQVCAQTRLKEDHSAPESYEQLSDEGIPTGSWHA